MVTCCGTALRSPGCISGARARTLSQFTIGRAAGSPLPALHTAQYCAALSLAPNVATEALRSVASFSAIDAFL
jgi:hypothetical protein